MREQFKLWWSHRTDAGHSHLTEEWFQRNAHELLSLFPARGTLLDVGCGNAQLLVYLAPHYEHVVGIDYTPLMLEQAQARVAAFGLKNVQLEQGDACQFPSIVDHADVILTNGVVQNLTSQEIRQHLAECRRVLRPGGMVGMCGIPCVHLRNAYMFGGDIDRPPSGALVQLARSLKRRACYYWRRCRQSCMSDGIGLWYSRTQIRNWQRPKVFPAIR